MARSGAMSPIFRRVLSSTWTATAVAIGGAWTALNWVSNFLGLTQVPTDGPEKGGKFLEWLVSTPPWVPALLALGLLTCHIYLAWRFAREAVTGQSAAAASAAATEEVRDWVTKMKRKMQLARKLERLAHQQMVLAAWRKRLDEDAFTGTHRGYRGNIIRDWNRGGVVGDEVFQAMLDLLGGEPNLTSVAESLKTYRDKPPTIAPDEDKVVGSEGKRLQYRDAVAMHAAILVAMKPTISTFENEIQGINTWLIKN